MEILSKIKERIFNFLKDEESKYEVYSLILALILFLFFKTHPSHTILAGVTILGISLSIIVTIQIIIKREGLEELIT